MKTTDGQKILITSALPYANGPLHFGHIAGAYLPGDCYARFQRLMGSDVLYICGSDEYGIAITLSAEMAKRSPKEHVDIFHAVNLDFFKALDISFDHYSRTSAPGHKEVVQKYFLDLLHSGYIEERETEQLYSDADQKFLADRYVVGTCPRCGYDAARGDECQKCGASYEATDLKNPLSKLTYAPLIRKPTKHYFLLLEKFKDRLTEWISKKDWKPNVVNFVKGYINELHARAITRDMTWGVPIPLPETDGKVLYVWFDAPIGYITATKEWARQQGQEDLFKKYWCDPKTKLVQFVGKDNIPFHAVIFPAMTMGQSEPFKLVDDLPANEFYNLEGRQFSKSDGWYIDLESFFKSYTSDQIRYAIAANAPETADSEFTWKDFQMRCNTELLGKYGNFVNRVLVFAKNNCKGQVPAIGILQPIDTEFLANMHKLVNEAQEAFNAYKLRRASQLVMELAQLGNVYFDAKSPWKYSKDATLKPAMETTIACCLQCLQSLALISLPIIPNVATKVLKMLQVDSKTPSWERLTNEELPCGHVLGAPEILFTRVEDEQIQKELEKLNAMSSKKQIPTLTPKAKEIAPMKEKITIDDVNKMDLRVATVLNAERVPKSKKLLQLKIDLGFETRTIVAGIGLSYTPEQMVGKKIIVVANLEPATLMGIQSQGMLFAAKSETELELPSFANISNGSVVG